MEYTIKILSPVHIFDRYVEPFEIIELQDRIILISESKLLSFLKERGLIKEFCRLIDSDISLIGDFLKKHAKGISLRELAVRTIAKPEHLLIRRFQSTVTEGIFFTPFIPASTIKGFIRTALLYKVLRNNPDIACEKENMLLAKMEEIKKNPRIRKKWAKEIGKTIDNLLCEADLAWAKKGPNTDYLRALRLTDAHITPGRQPATSLQHVMVFSMQNVNGKQKFGFKPRINIHVETIAPGTVFSGRLTLDTDLLNMFTGTKPFHTVEDVMNDLDSFTGELLATEINCQEKHGFPNMKEYLESYRGKANLRLGWGTGYFTHSTSLAFSERLQKATRDTFYHPRGPFPFPKSQKVLEERGWATGSLGWAKLTIKE